MENFDLVRDPEHTLKLCGGCKQEKFIVPNFSVIFRKTRNRRTIASHCKECMRRKSKLWHDAHRHTAEYKARSKEYSKQRVLDGSGNKWAKERYQKFKDIVFSHYGNVCSCCGESTVEFLTIEHTLHNGKQHRATKKSGIYRDIVNKGFPSDLTLFCANCNFATRYGNACPHKQRSKETLISTIVISDLN